MLLHWQSTPRWSCSMCSGSQLNYALWKNTTSYFFWICHLIILFDPPWVLYYKRHLMNIPCSFFSITLLYRFLSFSSLAVSLPGWRFSIYLIALYHHCHPFLVLLSLLFSPPHPSFKSRDQNSTQRSRQKHRQFINWHSRLLLWEQKFLCEKIFPNFFFFWPVPNTQSMPDLAR